MFGLAGTLLGELWRRSRATLAANVIMVCAVVALPVVWNRFGPIFRPPHRVWMALAVAGVAGILLAVLAYWPKLPVRNASAALLILAGFVGPAMEPGLQYVWALHPVLHGSNLWNGQHADVFRCLMDLHDELKTVDPARRLQFWWDKDDPAANVFLSAAAMNLAGGDQDYKKDLRTGTRAEVQASFFPDATLVHLAMNSDRILER